MLPPPQMIYIDNIDLGPLSKKHAVFPRIIDFESETQINKMIMEDMLPKVSGQVDTIWGASKVDLILCYSVNLDYCLV
jgi:hypothetical protein